MLFDDVKKRMMAAMKAHNTVEKEVLRTAIGEITATGGPTHDEIVLAVLRKLLKSNRDTLALATDETQKSTLLQEIAVIQDFLPKAMDPAMMVDVLAPVADAIRAAANEGQATGIAMKHLKSVNAVVESSDVKAVVSKIRA
ncbi:MAG: GatB/YqeY domain-containing protein [Deltaproteobacteria bacterium]|nr:GatB/YqeY domain-containing protein [Deltaproteobacteria bacterium]